MQRKQIHQQIEVIVGKLYQLNKYLLTSEDMLEIEVDLIKTYMAELNRLTALLNTENTTKETAEAVQPETIAEEPVAEIIIDEPTKAEEIFPPTVVVTPVAEKAETKTETNEPEPETVTEQEDIRFIKEEIIAPIVHEVEKEIKVVEAQVKEVVTHIKTEIGNKSLNELFSGNKIELADKLFNHSTGKPLKDFISIGDKFMFISELFNKDLMAYESAIKKLNEIHSLEEAHQYIEQELNNRFDWSKKQDAVKHFQSILKKKFGVADKN